MKDDCENLSAENGCLLPCCCYDDRVVDSSMLKICIFGVCCPTTYPCFVTFVTLLSANSGTSYAYTTDVPPLVVVKSIEESLNRKMDLESLGSPLKANRPIKDVFDEVLNSQGFFIEGDFSTTFTSCVSAIVDMISSLETSWKL